MPAELTVDVGPLRLKNPVMVGSSEATMTAAGIRAALDAGAAAVVVKSTNESQAAKAQLKAAEYVWLDADWSPIAAGEAGQGSSLLCRSGLAPQPFAEWLDMAVEADRHAADVGAYVVASLIVADLDAAVEMAKEIGRAGLRWLELNVGAPHGSEAAAGAIQAPSSADQVRDLVRRVREVVEIPLTVKLSGQHEILDDIAAARSAGADIVCVAGRSLAFLPDLETRRPHLGTFGAIGGSWALPLTLRWVAKARARFGAELAIIGTNGARSGADVARFLLAGASAVEMTTAYLSHGPAAVEAAVAELQAYLTDQGVDAAAVIGEAADNVRSYRERAEETHDHR